MNHKIKHNYEPADPGVGLRDDEHTIIVEITARSSDIDEAIRDAARELEDLRAHLNGDHHDDEPDHYCEARR